MSADRVAEALALLDQRERWARASTGSYGPVIGVAHPATVLRECAGWRAILARHQVTGGLGWRDEGGYGDIDPACTACGTPDEYAERWPCPTVRAVLDALLGPEETT